MKFCQEGSEIHVEMYTKYARNNMQEQRAHAVPSETKKTINKIFLIKIL